MAAWNVMARMRRLVSTLALCVFAASVFAINLPQSSLQAVLLASQARNYGTILGADFVNGRWEVYARRNGRTVEIYLADGTLTEVRRERKSKRFPTSRLSILQAATRALAHKPGTVVSAELERDREFGRVWSVEVISGSTRYEIYLHADSGRILEVESYSAHP